MYKKFFGLLKDVFWDWKIINVFIKYKSISNFKIYVNNRLIFVLLIVYSLFKFYKKKKNYYVNIIF